MENTPLDETISIPSWINVEFMKDLLSKDKNMDVCISDIKVRAAVPKGDNYMSTLYRVFVKYTENRSEKSVKNISFIVKTLPSGEFLQNFLQDIKGMEKEIHIYGTTFPSMYSLIHDKNTSRNFLTLTPNFYPTTRANMIILEDLHNLGYRMANRKNGLDLEHCKMAVRALARLHAGSLALYKMDSSSMDIFEEEMFQANGERRENMQCYFENNLKLLASEVEKWKGYEHYSEKIKKLIPTSLDRMTGIIKPKKDSFNVLNHGDCWVNNMLFCYCPETGKVRDVRFVDFQLSRFSSPALDLQYFLCTSASDDVRFHQRERLLEEYHEELSDTMKQLELDPEQYTLLQLKEDFEEKELFGLFTACILLCAMVADKDDTPEYADVKEKDLINGEVNVMGKAYSSSRFRQIFERMLLHYESKGLL